MAEERNDEARQGDEVKRSAPLGAPLEVYLGIFDEADAVRGVLNDLKGAGVSEEALTVFAGSQDADAFEAVAVERVNGFEGGTLLRKMFAADEVEREKVYHDAVASGSYVVQVQVPEEDETRRAAVEERLLQRGGRYIHYFGRLTFEEVVDDGDRQATAQG